VITNAQPGSAGGYSVVAGNPYNTVTSAVARLTVNLPPFITNPPAGLAVNVSSNAVFLVGAGGDQPLVYQWWFNSTNLLVGATNSTFVITNAQSTNAGGYDVIITNNYGSVTSAVAVLTVNLPVVTNAPVITVSGGPLQLAFPAQSAFRYYVEYKTLLTDASWQQLTNLPGANGPLLVPLQAPPGTRFYRVRVQ
jgi:hypothetical protein